MKIIMKIVLYAFLSCSVMAGAEKVTESEKFLELCTSKNDEFKNCVNKIESQIPLSYHSIMEIVAMMKAGEDGPGNGGGSPSASMKFYFAFPEEITPEQVKQIQEHLAERGGAFIMSPFHGYKKGYLEDEAVIFEKKRILKEEAFVNYWGIVPNEGVQNELMQRLLERAGLAEEDLYNSFSAYSQGKIPKIPDVGVGFVLEVPESYLKEKAGMAYKDYYDKGVQFMIGIPRLF